MRRLAGALLLVALAITAILIWPRSTAHRAGPDASTAESSAAPSSPQPASGVPRQAGAEQSPGEETRRDAAPAVAPEGADAILVVRIVDEQKAPLPGASVQVTYAGVEEMKSGPQAATDGNGTARLAVRPSTRASVTARVGGYSRWVWFNAARDQETTMTIVMPTGGKIAGVVRHVAKGPLANVRVFGQPEQQDLPEFIEARTDAQGGFVIDPVPPGSWRLSIGGKDVLLLRNYVSVKLGQGGSANVGIIVVGGGAIDGLVRDEVTSQPLAGVTVTLQDPVFQETTSDRLGRFRFEDLTPSLYDVSFSRHGYGQRSDADVEVKAGERTALTVALRPAAALDVYVCDTEGNPYVGPANLRYSAGGRSGGSSILLDEKGHASCATIPPGEYLLDVSSPTIEGSPMDVEITPGTNTVRFRVTRRSGWRGRTRSLHGTARDAATGAPLPGVYVWARSAGDTWTDERGEYVLADLEPGKCRPYAGRRDGYADHWLEEVTIVAGEERRLDFVLEPAATLHLRLKDQEGQPVTGEAQFIFVGLDEDRATGQLFFFVDADGRATVRRLRPGKHRLTIIMPGIGGADPKTTIVAGDNELEILLR